MLSLALAGWLWVPVSLAVEPITGAVPVAEQPAPEQLAPGLSVTYSYGMQAHVDDIEQLEDPVQGEPIAQLTHRTVDGNVLTSDRPMGVAAHIRGLIQLDRPGTYVFRIESNDGVKASIGGKRIWFDPEIHSNRWSEPIPLVIEQPGWYELAINYYQKKGTSALQLVWTPPGAASEEPVPASALAHLPQ
jgi:hypothetical protein